MKTYEEVIEDPDSANPLEQYLAAIEGVVPVIRRTIAQGDAKTLREALSVLSRGARAIQEGVDALDPPNKS